MSEDSKLNIKKKKNETFVVESLDNTAPVNKIISYLQSQKVKNRVYSYYCQTVRQRYTKSTSRYWTNLHFTLPGHPLNAFTDEFDGGLNAGYFEKFSYSSHLPKMITKLCNLEKQDPVVVLMKEKLEWQDKIVQYKRRIGQSSRKHKYKWHNDDVLECPKLYVDLAAIWDQNPSPHFDSHYNWNYAGSGNLHLVMINNQEYLLHSAFSCLYLLIFDKENLSIDFEGSTITFECGENNNILETVYSAQNIIALRTVYKIFILKIVESDIIHLEKMKVIESEIQFTSISFDDYHKNILYVTSLDCKLVIVNLDRMTGRTKVLREPPSLVDNWNAVLGWERPYYVHVTKNALAMYDKRTNNIMERWQNVRDLTDDSSCNDISIAKYCRGTSLLYFGTDHHLFLMDLRYSNGGDNKMKVVRRWTHGMQSTPTYIASCQFGHEQELVSVSSQWCEDLCLLSDYRPQPAPGREVRAVALPYRPPSLLATLNEARQKVLCCDIYDSIDSRLCTSITGQLVMERDDSYVVLMQNALGDISAHVLHPEHLAAFVNDDSPERLHQWSQLYKTERKDFEVSAIKDLSNVWRKLRRVPDDYVFGATTPQECHFDEKEIIEAFDSEQLDAGLLDVWTREHNETKTEPSMMNLFYSDDE